MAETDPWVIVSTYTRKQALADGVLIDVTTAAAQVGFKLHTAVTDNLYHHYLLPPPDLLGEGQSLEGRLHDLLFLASMAARANRNGDRAYFEVLFLMEPGHHEKVQVIAQVGPGDEGEPVLTLMLPGED